MALQTFNFPYHSVQTEYPNRGLSVALGGGWEYTVKPNTPIAVDLTLTFAAMKRFDEGLVLTDRQEDISLARLETFYREHEMHEYFLYEHPNLGNMVVKFSAPLVVPPGTIGGDGAVLNLTFRLKQRSIGY